MRYLKVADGVPLVPPEPEADAGQLEADIELWLEAYQNAVRPGAM
jgi:hypothetical protein